MQDPQQYFNTIAQMIVQSAAASAAQDEARMQREQDLAYRREQMGLERERMADQRRLTDVQIEGAKTENEGRRLAVNKAKQKDATERVYRERYFMQYGQYPEDRQTEVDRQTQDLTISDAQNRNVVSTAEAANAPTAISLRNSAAQAQIDAAKSAQSLDAYRLESEKAMEKFRLSTAEAQARGAGIANAAASLELSKARRNDLFARNGWLTPETQAALGAQFDSDIQKAHIEAANRAATKKDDLGNVTFDMDAYRKELDRVDYIAEASGKFRLLQKAKPNEAAKIQGALRIMGEQLIRTTSDPNAVGQALVTSLGAMVDSVGGVKPKFIGPPAPPPDDKPKETESGRRLKVKQANDEDIEKRINYSIQQTLKQLPDDVIAGLEAKYGGDTDKMVAAIRASFKKGIDYVPGNRAIAEVARSVAKGKLSMSPFTAAPTQ